MRKILTEKDITKVIYSVLREMKDASWSNNKYIVDMLKKGYLAHGTPNEDLKSFDAKYIKGGCRGEYGYGFYFTNELYKCLEYGTNIYFTPQNIYNFLDLREGNHFEEMVQQYDEIGREIQYCEDRLYDARNRQEYDYFTKELERLESLRDNLHDSDSFYLIMMIQRGIKDSNNTCDEHIYKYVINNLPSGMVKQVSGLLMKFGYDGVKCGNQFCIFNFDKLNNNIIE